MSYRDRHDRYRAVSFRARFGCRRAANSRGHTDRRHSASLHVRYDRRVRFAHRHVRRRFPV